jgi:hypothetical protein
MPAWLPTCAVLAEGVSPGPSAHAGWYNPWLLPAVVLAGMTLLLLFVRWTARNRVRNSSGDGRKLFFELCRAHHLNWSESRLLWRVAEGLSPEEPARLFVEPARLAPATLTGTLAKETSRLAALKARLFAGFDKQGAAM